MDISSTTAPKSDQQGYDDYIAGPKTVTVESVKAGTAEQPVEIHLVEFPGRPFKPSKTVRRILVTAWGAEASNYVGRRMTLYGDPTVKFGGIAVGGIRVSHLSHIEKQLDLLVTEARAKKGKVTIKPLEDAPTAPTITNDVVGDWVAQIQASESEAELRRTWADAIKQGVTSDARVVAAKDARKKELS